MPLWLLPILGFPSPDMPVFTPAARFNPVSTASAVPMPDVPGVWWKSGVKLREGYEENTKAMLRELRNKVGFDLVVTSAYRSPADQAAAVEPKILKGGPSAGKAVWPYSGSYSTDMLNAYAQGGRPALQAVVESYLAQGKAGSGHLVGNAVDLRLPSSQEEYNAIVSAASGMGLKVVQEDDHIHVEGFGDSFITAMIEGAKKNPLPVIIAVTAGVSVIGLSAFWVFTRRRNR